MTEYQINPTILSQVAETLETLVADGFGPNALNSMLCSSTGKLLVTNSGATVLKAINVSHPVGHMITRAVLKHHEVTGDGSKTFLFLLSGLLRHTRKCVDAEKNDSIYRVISGMYAVRYNILPNVLVPQLFRACRVVDNVGRAKEICRNVIHTVLQGKLNVTGIQHFVKITSAMFTDCQSMESVLQTARFHIDDFELFCIENQGKPIASSILLKGLLIQRDFTSLCSDFSKQSPVNLVITACTLEQELESSVTIKISSSRQLALALDYNAKRVRTIAEHLRKRGITLLIASVAVSRTSCDILRSHGVSVVAHVLEEDAERLSRFAGVLPVCDVDDLIDDEFSRNVVVCSKCVAVVVQQRRGILLQGLSPKSAVQTTLPNPAQMVVCGPTNGVSGHLKQCVLSCLEAVAMAFDTEKVMDTTGEFINDSDIGNGDGTENKVRPTTHKDVNGFLEIEQNSTESKPNQMYIIPGGGCLEIHMYRILDCYIKSNKHLVKASTIEACEILRDSLLAVPLKLVKNSYASTVNRLSLAHLVKGLKDHERCLVGVDAKLGNRLKVFEPTSVLSDLKTWKSGEMGKSTASKETEQEKPPAREGAKSTLSKGREVVAPNEITKESVRAKEREHVVVREEENQIVESVPSKVLMLYHVLELYSQLLRLNCIVSVRELPDHEEDRNSDSASDSD